MFAVYAESFSTDDPLSGLVVGERPDPDVPDGLDDGHGQGRRAQPPRPVVAAGRRACSEDALPMVLGCDAAGLDEDGNEVVVHAVISDPSWTGDETLDPKRSLLSRAPPGHVRRTRRRAAPQPRAEAGVAVASRRRPACRRRG